MPEQTILLRVHGEFSGAASLRQGEEAIRSFAKAARAITAPLLGVSQSFISALAPLTAMTPVTRQALTGLRSFSSGSRGLTYNLDSLAGSLAGVAAAGGVIGRATEDAMESIKYQASTVKSAYTSEQSVIRDLVASLQASSGEFLKGMLGTQEVTKGATIKATVLGDVIKKLRDDSFVPTSGALKTMAQQVRNVYTQMVEFGETGETAETETGKLLKEIGRLNPTFGQAREGVNALMLALDKSAASLKTIEDGAAAVAKTHIKELIPQLEKTETLNRTAPKSLKDLYKSLRDVKAITADMVPVYQEQTSQVMKDVEASRMSKENKALLATELTKLQESFSAASGALDAENQKMEEGGKVLPVWSSRTREGAAAMDLLSSMAQGSMLAMGVLNKSVLQTGFSFIFLRFSLEKLALACAGVILVLGVIAIGFKKLVGAVKLAMTENMRFTKSLSQLQIHTARSGMVLRQEFLKPFLDLVASPVVRFITGLVTSFTNLAVSFARGSGLVKDLTDGFAQHAKVIQFLGLILKVTLIPPFLALLVVLKLLAWGIKVLSVPLALLAKIPGVSKAFKILAITIGAFLTPALVALDILLLRLAITTFRTLYMAIWKSIYAMVVSNKTLALYILRVKGMIAAEIAKNSVLGVSILLTKTLVQGVLYYIAVLRLWWKHIFLVTLHKEGLIAALRVMFRDLKLLTREVLKSIVAFIKLSLAMMKNSLIAITHGKVFLLVANSLKAVALWALKTAAHLAHVVATKNIHGLSMMVTITKAWTAAQWLLNAALTVTKLLIASFILPLALVVAAAAVLIAKWDELTSGIRILNTVLVILSALLVAIGAVLLIAVVPIGWVVAGIGGLVAVISILIVSFNPLRDAIRVVGDAFTEFGRVVAGSFQFVCDAVSLIGGLIAGVFKTIASAIGSASEAVGGFFTETLFPFFGKVVDFFKEWWPFALGVMFPPLLIVAALIKFWDPITNFFSGIGDWLWDNIAKPIGHFFSETFLNFFTETVYGAFKKLRNVILNALADVVGWALDALAGILGGLGNIPGLGGLSGWAESLRGVSARLHAGMAAQKGALIKKPTLVLAGEAGPEAIVPLTGPNARAIAPNIIINITGNYILDDSTAQKLANAVSAKVLSTLSHRRGYSVL